MDYRYKIDEIDKKVISAIQGDLPLDPRPFALAAKKVSISEEEFIMRVRRLKREGIIRRFGATLRHQEAGYGSNAMVAWCVPEDRIEEVGRTFAVFRRVTHCYHRKPTKTWPYNIYTMIHGASEEECRRLAKEMAKRVGIQDYQVLFSQREFKKTSMQYF